MSFVTDTGCLPRRRNNAAHCTVRSFCTAAFLRAVAAFTIQNGLWGCLLSSFLCTSCLRCCMSWLVWQSDSFSSVSLIFLLYFVLTGQILGVSGNQRCVVILGGAGPTCLNVPVKLWEENMDGLITVCCNVCPICLHFCQQKHNELLELNVVDLII